MILSKTIECDGIDCGRIVRMGVVACYLPPQWIEVIESESEGADAVPKRTITKHYCYECRVKGV